MTRYLTKTEVIAINAMVIQKYSPTEDKGVKDLNALESTIAQPQQEVYEVVLYPTIYHKAAILFELLIKNHCFYNGNKRTATMALYTFLDMNHIHLVVSNKEMADMSVDIAAKRGAEEIQHEEIVEWLKANSRKK